MAISSAVAVVCAMELAGVVRHGGSPYYGHQA